MTPNSIDPPKRRGGKPKRIFTDHEYGMLKVLLSCGTPLEALAECLRCSTGTLKRDPKYKEFARTAKLEVKALMVGQVIAAARRGEAWAPCFWLKTQYPEEFAERLKVDQTGEVRVKGALSAEPMTAEEWALKYGAPQAALN